MICTILYVAPAPVPFFTLSLRLRSCDIGVMGLQKCAELKDAAHMCYVRSSEYALKSPRSSDARATATAV